MLGINALVARYRHILEQVPASPTAAEKRHPSTAAPVLTLVRGRGVPPHKGHA
jgi:hypothetical protein